MASLSAEPFTTGTAVPSRWPSTVNVTVPSAAGTVAVNRIAPPRVAGLAVEVTVVVVAALPMVTEYVADAELTGLVAVTVKPNVPPAVGVPGSVPAGGRGRPRGGAPPGDPN